jgi:inosine-uridine nucleoside N-ribohydrolase
MIYDRYAFRVPKEKMIRVITDTDAKNEADDQFAIVQALLSPRFDNRGFIAAHFNPEKSARSMEESREEIEKIFDLMDFPKDGMIFDGATGPLANEREARPSAGAELIVREAMADDPRPLYVTFLGPLTDLASAYLMEPRIAGRLTAIWIGGGRYPAGGREYNLSNDIVAANVVMKSPIPLWQVTQNVYSSVRVSLAELERRVRPCGKIGAYLCDQLDDHANSRFGIRPYIRTGEVWFLGDSPAVGLLLCDHEFEYDWVPAPEITSDMAYLHTGKHRPIRVYRSIDTRFIMEDFYAKLELFANKGEGKK